uniref:Putative secreted protein n=1 Tax=Ixodes ricinus TaxID=34613 RepID=A0A6B0UDC0_IXORI
MPSGVLWLCMHVRGARGGQAGQLKLLTVVLTPSATRLRLVRTGDVSPVVITATFLKHVVGVVQRNLALHKLQDQLHLPRLRGGDRIEHYG